MRVVFDREEPDIIIPCEGTYPYVRGGVSSWIAQIIAGMPQYNLELYLLGVEPETTHKTSL